MTEEEIHRMIDALGDMAQDIKDADPADKAEVYANIGLSLLYRPQKRLVPNPLTCRGFRRT